MGDDRAAELKIEISKPLIKIASVSRDQSRRLDGLLAYQGVQRCAGGALEGFKRQPSTMSRTAKPSGVTSRTARLV
jgi:hypothetical protein